MIPSTQTLKRAIVIAEQIEALQAELESILGSSKSGRARADDSLAKSPRGRKKRKKLSAESLANMRAAQQARWARVRGKSALSKSPKTDGRKKKRKMSAAGRAAIAAAQQLRWAKIKADKARTAKKD